MTELVEKLPNLDTEMKCRPPKYEIQENHILLGRDDGTQVGNKKYYILCKNCAKDYLLYRDGIFKVSSRELINKTACCCNGRLRKAPMWHILELIKRQCKEKDYTFLGFVGKDYSGNKSTAYLKLQCQCGHYWETTSLAKFIDLNRGCPSCAGTVPWDKERFLKGAYKAHGDLYDYSLVHNVINSKHKVPILCKDHGVFYSDAHHHIGRSQGCPHIGCVGSKISETRSDSTKDFIEKAISVHGDNYNYSNTIYTRSFNKLNIFCNSCLTEFYQSPTDHLAGCGCQCCAGRNQKQSYIFLIEDLAFKFGIANVYTTRFNKQKGKTDLKTVVFGVWEYDTTESCKEAEKYIIKNFKCGFLTKMQYPDGYSETLPICNLDDVIKVYDDFGARRLL